MPEVYAPLPQRVMPEVPQNMQNDLQRLESSAKATEFHPGEERPLNPLTPRASPPSEPSPGILKPAHVSNDAPTFSPFPKVKGDGIPPSFEEIEQTLWDNREQTLHSNNVPMQLAWAKQVLAWVEVIMEDLDRELDGKPRPPTPNAEHQMRWLEFGKFGHRMDKREAYNGYKKAAELGTGRAEYRMGMLFEASNDMRNAIQHYQRGLETGDSAASYRLGMMSLMGQHGQIKDYHHGLSLIEAAADSADEDAPQGAYSALLGFAKAQLKLGQAYELCQLGCDFNPSFSLHYYGLAAKQGQAEAALGVSRWFLFGYEGFFNKNEQLAYRYAKQAADGKLATGEFAMGYYHEIGIHVSKDLREAKKWYELAAEHGNKDAIGRLESINEQKTLTKHDHETTTLTRIKSQHGSMRGKRPDRFTQKPAAMPVVSEGDAEHPVSRLASPLTCRQSAPIKGPAADRPMSAFGIRPLSAGSSGRPPQGNLGPGDQRGRVNAAGWEPPVSNDYRQASPSPATGVISGEILTVKTRHGRPPSNLMTAVKAAPHKIPARAACKSLILMDSVPLAQLQAVSTRGPRVPVSPPWLVEITGPGHPLALINLASNSHLIAPSRSRTEGAPRTPQGLTALTPCLLTLRRMAIPVPDPSAILTDHGP
ncbi:unnamed protein product [Parascedosporium putredinis]|uniref:HCP-like protein n=1 Tax=Parascedosporium putredinis TaxID=1442378 RepID=A0A9P1GYR5_9PEZI|nr:unnamed protein product [Parascedosporium putredinis]CAI7992095.1 unnamed protein product [Parascedosporium putredinis]